MVFAAIALVCCVTAFPNSSNVSTERTTPVVASSDASTPAVKAETGQPARPDAPIAKNISAISSNADDASPESSNAESITPGSQPFLNAPAKPAIQGTYETARQRKIWYGLVAASSGAAAFDAWTTRRAISGNYGVEGDPLLRPFAHSNAIYAATQVSPAIMDYLGHRMMTNHHEWMRKMWWVPQVAGTSFSLSAGIHNYRLVPHN
ncbi:MAG TPA: hypothetical protein VGF61_20705 [Candidatus Acidoferrum sp.]|jgi:hypothetical protein